MKGIILAGGHGTRLHPLTRAVSKQLLPVYDKPMIYYPLSVLIECGIREICVITKTEDMNIFCGLLGDGSQWGVRFSYRSQYKPRGIADAFFIADAFIGGDSVCLILGDNIFLGTHNIVKAVRDFKGGAHIFGYESATPERYGVVGFNGAGNVSSIEEKPKVPRSAYVVTGCYLYDKHVVNIAKRLKPSARGELEITDVNSAYLARGGLNYWPLGAGVVWLDCGTPDDLHWAASCIRGRQQEEKRKIGCPDEAAKRRDHVV